MYRQHYETMLLLYSSLYSKTDIYIYIYMYVCIKRMTYYSLYASQEFGKTKRKTHSCHCTQLSKTTWRHEGSEGIAPRILNLGIRWRWTVGFTPRPLCTLRLIRTKRWEAKKKNLFPPGIEHWFVGRTARYLVTTRTELPPLRKRNRRIVLERL